MERESTGDARVGLPERPRRAALRAVRAMRNAIRWMIVKGREVFEGEVDLDALRRSGRILMEVAS